MLTHKIYPDSSSIFQTSTEPSAHVIPTLVTGYRALPLVVHFSKLIKLCQIILSNSYLITLTKSHPRLLYKYLGGYLARNFSREDRLSILVNHYYFLSKRAKPNFFEHILREAVIWHQCIDELNLTIKMKFPIGIDFDGDLTLIFELDDMPIYAISFTFIPANIIDGSFDQAIFVGRIQGLNTFELIKKVTKRVHDITPASLLIVALQGIGMAFNINKIFGVSNKTHLYRHSRDSKEHFFDYDSFWYSFSVEYCNDFFYLPIPYSEKPLSDIKSNHRTRTIRKRAYKSQLCQSVLDYSKHRLVNVSSYQEPYKAVKVE